MVGEINLQELNDDIKNCLDVLKQEKGKTKKSAEARLKAREGLAHLYATADQAGMYVGQEFPTWKARKDKEAMLETLIGIITSRKSIPDARHREVISRDHERKMGLL